MNIFEKFFSQEDRISYRDFDSDSELYKARNARIEKRRRDRIEKKKKKKEKKKETPNS